MPAEPCSFADNLAALRLHIYLYTVYLFLFAQGLDPAASLRVCVYLL